jgi:hypothetical protein
MRQEDFNRGTFLMDMISVSSIRHCLDRYLDIHQFDQELNRTRLIGNCIMHVVVAAQEKSRRKRVRVATRRRARRGIETEKQSKETDQNAG